MQDIISRFSTVCTVAEIEGYLFGSQEIRTDLLEDLISEFSQCTLALDSTQSPQIPFLRGHPERLLTLDDISEAKSSGMDTYDMEGAVDALLDGTSLQSDGIVPAFAFAKLGHHFMNQFGRFSEIDDLDEAISYYQECLGIFPQNDHHYLEILLGLSSAFYHRLRLLGGEKDLQQLIMLLRTQHAIDIKGVSWPTIFQGVFSAAITDSHPSLTSRFPVGNIQGLAQIRNSNSSNEAEPVRKIEESQSELNKRNDYLNRPMMVVYVASSFIIFCSNTLSSNQQQEANDGNGPRAAPNGDPWTPNRSFEPPNAQGTRPPMGQGLNQSHLPIQGDPMQSSPSLQQVQSQGNDLLNQGLVPPCTIPTPEQPPQSIPQHPGLFTNDMGAPSGPFVNFNTQQQHSPVGGAQPGRPGSVTVSDDEESGNIEVDEEDGSAMDTDLPSTASLATSGKKLSPTCATTSSADNDQPLSLPGRTASSASVTKGKRVSIEAPSRRTSRSRSIGGSHSRSRSCEPPSAGIGHADFSPTEAAVPLPPAPGLSQKALAIVNMRGGRGGRGMFSVARGVKARGVVKMNSGGLGLGNEIDALEKEQADMQMMRDQALEVERQRHLEHEERARRTEEEIATTWERLGQHRLASERERGREEEHAETERQRQLERPPAPNPVEGSSRRPARFNIGSNSDEGISLSSKSVESGSDMSGDNNMRGAAGLHSGPGKGKEKEQASQEVLAAEKERVQNPYEQPQRQHQLEQYFRHPQQPAHPQPQQQSQKLQPGRQLNKGQLQLMEPTQLYLDHHFSSRPPSPQVSTKQLEPFQGLEKVVDPTNEKERETAPALAPVPAPVASKQPTNDNSSVTVPPYSTSPDVLHTYVVSQARNVPQFAWTSLRSKEVDANTILPPLIKCWAMEQEGFVTLNQLWIIIYTFSGQPDVKLIASCTEGLTGSYPIFIFTPIPTQHIERERTILFLGLNCIVRELFDRVDRKRVYSVFALEKLSATFASLWTKATRVPLMMRGPYKKEKISFLTAQTLRRDDPPIPYNKTYDLRLAVRADREHVARLCYEFAADSVCLLLLSHYTYL